MNITKHMKTKLMIFALLVGFVASCKQYDEKITDWYYTSDDLEKWIVDSTQFRFEMIDQNGITREFINRSNEHYFSEGNSYFAGVKYSRSQREYFYQQFKSNYNDNFNISITPEHKSYWGEQISFNISDLHFSYDFFFNEVLSIETNGQSKHVIIYTDGIQSDSLFKSTFQLIDIFEVGDQSYERVFHFHLNDFKSIWNENTITDVYYAQGVGLVQYNINNGLILKRK
jgi:hypothetical protein